MEDIASTAIEHEAEAKIWARYISIFAAMRNNNVALVDNQEFLEFALNNDRGQAQFGIGPTLPVPNNFLWPTLSIIDIEFDPINIPPNQEVASLLLSSDGAKPISDYDKLRAALDAVFDQRVSEGLEFLILNAVPYIQVPSTCSEETTNAANEL